MPSNIYVTPSNTQPCLFQNNKGVLINNEMSAENLVGSVKLWTKSYIFICIANFMICFSFYMLTPTLPFYLMEELHIQSSAMGIVLSCYVLAILCARPFSGFLADTFSRKPLYLIAYFLFTSIFLGYLSAGTLTLFVILRIFHGLTYGTISTTGSTLIIDVCHTSRRGEGLGYYGVMNNLAMAFGPMFGLLIYGSHHFDYIFYTATAVGCIGFLFAISAKVPIKSGKKAREASLADTNTILSDSQEALPKKTKAISLDRFFLLKGLPAFLSMALFSLPYGMTTTYIALYAKDCGLNANIGLFFSVTALGLIVSRIFSGKRVDHGYITQTIVAGMIVAAVGIFGEFLLKDVCAWNLSLGFVFYLFVALCIGIGFGLMVPAINTVFINLAPNNRRATANATYLTSWDVGNGIGTFIGGTLSSMSNGLQYSFLIGTCTACLSILFFTTQAIPHFNKNRLR